MVKSTLGLRHDAIYANTQSQCQRSSEVKSTQAVDLPESLLLPFLPCMICTFDESVAKIRAINSVFSKHRGRESDLSREQYHVSACPAKLSIAC